MSPETKRGRPITNSYLFNQRSNPNKNSSRENNGRNFKPNAVDSDDVLGIYLNEVSSVPLLTARQEVDLFKRIERGRKASTLLYENKVEGEVSSQRQGRLNSLIEDGIAARDHLLTSNQRLVISIAKIYMGRGVDFKDLIQEGSIGMIRAARKFDYHRGLKFSTYSTWWIRQAVSRAVAEQGRTIRIPVHLGDQIKKMLSVSNQFTQLMGREPTIDELAVVLDLNEEKVTELIQANNKTVSLESPTGVEEDSVLGDFIEDKSLEDPPTQVIQNILSEDLDKVLTGLLDSRDKRILELRFGLTGGEIHSLEDVGKHFGITRERVRQLEDKAIRKLRHPVYRKMFSDYLKD